MSRGSAITALLALTLAASATPARAAEEIWVLTVNNGLANFISSSPNAFSQRPITGMAPGEQALAIDFRPAAPLGRLYAITNQGRLYRIDDPSTGAAVAVGPGGLPVPAGAAIGFDFNPTVDRIRLVTSQDGNFRLHPDLGTVVFTDGALAYAAADPNAGANPGVSGAAYTQNVPNASSTTLYDIDTDLDVLVTQVPPNSGVLNTVGPLGVNASGVNGFDISGLSGHAWAALDTGAPQSQLYVISLSSGAATSVGWIGCQEPIIGLSVSPLAPTPVDGSSWGRIKSLYR